MQGEDPFEHLDFEEEIKAVNWELLGTKLTTPTMEAALLPSGNLVLKRGDKVFGVERSDVEALFRFLDRVAEIAPLPAPDEDFFRNFTPTPVDLSTEQEETAPGAPISPDYQPVAGDFYTIETTAGYHTVYRHNGEEWSMLTHNVSNEGVENLTRSMQFLGRDTQGCQYYRLKIAE